MSWEFLDIFKKADFNKLMFSIAVAGWIVFFSPIPEQIKYYILGISILASVYCLSGLAVYCHKQVKLKRDQKKQKKNRELYDKKIEESKRVEIGRMFEGLTKENKDALAVVVMKGKEDKFQQNVLHYNRNDYQLINVIGHVESTCRIFRTGYLHAYDPHGGQPCITITNYADTITVTIEPYLLELAKQYNLE